MNCCDEYGKCRQGRDCPVRVERIRDAKRRLDRAARGSMAKRIVTWLIHGAIGWIVIAVTVASVMRGMA